MAIKAVLVSRNTAVIAALIGVIELLGALGCLICTLMFGNITNTAVNKGRLYSKYYDSASPTRRYGENGGTYWWAGLPFLLPGMIGIGAYATRKISVMIAFLVFNAISFFSGIALAIFVGLFYNLWKVPMNAYSTNNCVFEYHEPTFQTFCQCNIVDSADVKLMDADRLWIFVQGCDEVETINIMLITIISLAIITGIIALICCFMACYAIRFPERPKSTTNKGFNPLPAQFLLTEQNQQSKETQQAPPQPRDDYARDEQVFENKAAKKSYGYDDKPKQSYGYDDKPKQSYGYDDKPKQSYGYDDKPKQSYGYDDKPRAAYGYEGKPKSYKEQYASQYPPPYPDNSDIKKQPDDESDDEEEGVDAGWL